MNKERRKNLASIVERLEELQGALDDLATEEEEYRDNMPENLTGSAKYEKSDEAANSLREAFDALGDAMDSINSAIGED